MDSKQIYQIRGMHCASCVKVIEDAIKKVEGVQMAEVNFGTEQLKVTTGDVKVELEVLQSVLDPLGYKLIGDTSHHEGHENHNGHDGQNHEDHSAHTGLGQSKKEKLAEIKDMRNKVMIALPIAIFSIFVMSWEILADLGVMGEISMVWMDLFHHLMPVFATYILLVVGQPYLKGVYRFARYGKANMDTLIGLGTSVAYLYSLAITSLKTVLEPYVNVQQGYYDVTIVVITFVALGKYLEAKSKLKTGDAIEKLLGLQAKTALVIRDGVEVEISVTEVVKGDLVVVKPGMKIPVDGIITEGESYLNESMITGESMPVQKKVDDLVVAGTLNTSGAFVFKATKVGDETLLAQIVKMVAEAQGSKAPIQALADKISGVFVPIVLVVAVVALALWIVIGSQYMDFSRALSLGLTSFVGILIIACPCALGLATPTAIIVGVGKGARMGILVKDAESLEKLHKVEVVVVDKTGTITIGEPMVVDTESFDDLDPNDLIGLIASLESKSEHPIAVAITSYAKTNDIQFEKAHNFEPIQGQGIKGTIDGVEYFAGNVHLMKDLGLSFDESRLDEFTVQGKTPVILATSKKVLGFVMVADKVKPESQQAVQDLHKMGIKVVMLTGDDEKTAQYIAKMVGIDEVVANVMPQDKLAKISELQSQGKVVAMAGDGVNDAPALAKADVGIAMGTGTDVAIESAGITLLHGDISKLVKSIKLSRMTMRGIKQNLFWAFVYNTVGIPLASGLFYPIFGWLLSPVFAGFAMAASSVSVVANSLRIKNKKL